MREIASVMRVGSWRHGGVALLAAALVATTTALAIPAVAAGNVADVGRSVIVRFESYPGDKACITPRSIYLSSGLYKISVGQDFDVTGFNEWWSSPLVDRLSAGNYMWYDCVEHQSSSQYYHYAYVIGPSYLNSRSWTINYETGLGPRPGLWFGSRLVRMGD